MKRVIFFVLSLLVLLLFACDFKVPTTIEVKGTPTIRFAEEFNLGEKFTSLLDDAVKDAAKENENESMTILHCDNTENFTFLIHMDLFHETFDLDDDPELDGLPGHEFGDILDDLADGGFCVLNRDRNIIISDPDTPTKVPFSSLGSHFEGFRFNEHKIKLYFSGSDIVDKAKMDITFNIIDKDGVLKDTKVYSGLDVINEKSDFENWNDVYTSKDPPSGGVDLHGLPLEGNDIEVSYRVYLPDGTGLLSGDLHNGIINIEVVVWLPFVLEAIEDGAVIDFPKDALFSSEKDLFDRKSPGEENMMIDIIESLSLEIKFNKNPFIGSKLIISSNGIEIENELKGDSFPFKFDENDMKKINNPANFPFAPNLKLVFPLGSTLIFPKVINATELLFNAKIKYRVDL